VAVIPALAMLALLLLGARSAPAQDTRAETIREQQAGKQKVIAPPTRNRAEVLIDRLEDWGIFTGQPQGLYPWVGSVFPGGGIAAGAGVRTSFGDDGAVNLFGGSSLERFWHAGGSVELPTLVEGRARVTLSGRYTEAPDVTHHGVGNDTSKADVAYYGYRPAAGEARLDFDALTYVSVGGGVTYLHIRTSPGRTSPSIEQRFPTAAVAGLVADAIDYIKTSARATVDWRLPVGYSGSGGLYRVQFDDYHDGDGGAHSFHSVEAEVRQLIPVLRANWVLAIGGLATVTDVDEGRVIPYFMLPSLGGGATLRGYPDFRFRDRHRLLMNAELRWTRHDSWTWHFSTTRGRWHPVAATWTSMGCTTPTASGCE
jgi:hypothetical protein